MAGGHSMVWYSSVARRPPATPRFAFKGGGEVGPEGAPNLPRSKVHPASSPGGFRLTPLPQNDPWLWARPAPVRRAAETFREEHPGAFVFGIGAGEPGWQLPDLSTRSIPSAIVVAGPSFRPLTDPSDLGGFVRIANQIPGVRFALVRHGFSLDEATEGFVSACPKVRSVQPLDRFMGRFRHVLVQTLRGR